MEHFHYITIIVVLVIMFLGMGTVFYFHKNPTEGFTGGRGTDPNIRGADLTSKGQKLVIPSDHLAYGDHARPDQSLLSGQVGVGPGYQSNLSHVVHKKGKRCYVAKENNFPGHLAYLTGTDFTPDAIGEIHALQSVGAMPSVRGSADSKFDEHLQNAVDDIEPECKNIAIAHPPHTDDSAKGGKAPGAKVLPPIGVTPHDA